ncbi:bacterial Ig-like domain protein [Methanobrevibacter cuticularis]|uniref:Bacterial Ig-like domain protein n=1 Tax=Methanobrevibacter cuticularis TaxID=47311 RepID=A0A166CWB5_9EURY|nr:bacterial Ig-like domain protein [Methanobrevibacter cuticularis]
MNFIVSKSGTIINVDLPTDAVYGENSTIAGNITDANGNLINGTYNITITINGIEYNVTVIDGSWNLTIPNTIVGLNTITVNYSGTNNYENSDLNIDFNVTKANTTININLPNNATYGGNSTINGNITDANGNLINGTYNIIVTINGVEYNVTVIDGLWSLTIPNTNVGIANVDISFPGNNNYNNATITTNYTVAPKNLGTKITITSTRNGNKITYKITLKDNQGNTLANQNISLTIAGKIVSLRINGQGIAQYTYTATKAGKYYANAAYNGLNTENIIYGHSSAKSNTISITKTNIKVYHVAKSAKTVKYHGKRYRVYYKTYYIKNYGILTGSKLFQKSLKGFTLSKISKTSNIKTNYNKTKKILKTSVKNLAYAKIAKIKIKFYKRIA